MDGFTNHLKTEHNVNDVSVVSYLRSVRAFIYYCMECNYMTTFKIHLPKAQKDIKEIYSNEQLEKLLVKPDLIDFDNGMIMLRKTKNRTPIGVNLSTVRYAHNALPKSCS